MLLKKIQNINFSESTKDANGLAFQKFLNCYAKEGRGQFFTPDPVIGFCVEILHPKPDEKIIDPACGTGGFLFSALNYIKRDSNEENIQEYVKNNIVGIEINKKVPQIAKIKFLIETNADPNIICENALKTSSDIKFLDAKENDVKENNVANSYDIVMTNPPFWNSEKDYSERNIVKL